MITINPDTVGWIILKAREYDVKEADTSDGEEAADDPGAVLQDRPDDPTADELICWIDDLNDQEAAELVALMWLGRGDAAPEEFPSLIEQAREAQSGTKTSRYLLGVPLLADYLEEGLQAIGMNAADVEGNLR